MSASWSTCALNCAPKDIMLLSTGIALRFSVSEAHRIESLSDERVELITLSLDVGREAVP